MILIKTDLVDTKVELMNILVNSFIIYNYISIHKPTNMHQIHNISPLFFLAQICGWWLLYSFENHIDSFQ